MTNLSSRLLRSWPNTVQRRLRRNTTHSGRPSSTKQAGEAEVGVEVEEAGQGGDRLLLLLRQQVLRLL